MKKLFLIFSVLLLLACHKTEADPFTMEFYEIVNQYRVDLGLNELERSPAVEKIALTYSEIIAKNGSLDHFALTPFEFKQLCKNYGIEHVILKEILAYYPIGKTPWFVFESFIISTIHREVIEEENGEFIGANYANKNGRQYFTAYIILKETQ